MDTFVGCMKCDWVIKANSIPEERICSCPICGSPIEKKETLTGYDEKK